jgi:hypothetical protein
MIHVLDRKSHTFSLIEQLVRYNESFLRKDLSAYNKMRLTEEELVDVQELTWNHKD